MIPSKVVNVVFKVVMVMDGGFSGGWRDTKGWWLGFNSGVQNTYNEMKRVREWECEDVSDNK